MSSSLQSTLKVCKSSAGSGKTTRLVYEYLRLVLPSPDNYRRILAVTFTNKAANEMKERIISYLRFMVSPQSASDTLPPDMEASLRELLHEQNKDPQVQATRCLNMILHNYSDFAVSTIDSFVYRVIRSFAKDLGLSWDFEVQMDVNEMLEEIIDLLMEEYGKDELVTRQIYKLMEDKLTDNKSWRLERDILYFAANLLGSDTDPRHLKEILETPGDHYAKVGRWLYSSNKELLSRAQATAEKAMCLMDQHHICVNDLSFKKSGLGGWMHQIADANAEKVMELNKNAEKSVGSGRLYAKSEKNKTLISRIEAITPQIIELYKELNAIHNEKEVYYARKAVMGNLHIMSIINIIYSIWEEVKQEHSVLPISEFSRSIARVTLSEDIPYIYERLGERYHHFFIDEFQDTSTLQWENMLPLLEHSLSSGHFNLLVGDVKQAIYRFRGGNTELLGMMPDPPPGLTSTKSYNRYQAIQEGIRLEQLDTNYRSRREIIDFNNDFFRFVHSNLPSEQSPFYDDVEQNKHRQAGGQVSISFRPREDHAERTMEIIELLLEQGYAQRDIAILCRNNAQAQSLAVHLLGCSTNASNPGQPPHPLNVISDESLTLKQSPQVNVLIATARLQTNPENNVVTAHIAHYLFGKSQTNKDFHSWIRNYGGMPKGTNALESLAQKEGYQLNLTNLWKNNLYQLFQIMSKKLKMDYLNDPYLRFFMDEVLRFTQNNPAAGIYRFLQYWDQTGHNKSIVSPTGTDAILIKTIHKSKGLAFPVVIYPFAEEKAYRTNNKYPQYRWVPLTKLGLNKPTSSVVKLSKSLSMSKYKETMEKEILASQLDMVNLLYVCMTRPRERMYIITSNQDNNNNAPLYSLTNLFHAYITSLGKEPADDYCFPEKTAPPQKKEPEKKESQPPAYTYKTLINWQKKLFVRKPQTPAISSTKKPENKGKVLHHYLAMVQNAGELVSTLKRISSEVSPEDQRNEIKDTVKQIITHPKLSQYFLDTESQTIKTECNLATPDGIIRPDRVCIMPHQVVVIDYKTGKQDESHNEQMGNYAKSLKGMYKVPVKTLLVYDQKPIQIIESTV